MFYINEDLYLNKDNIEKVGKVLFDLEIDVGADVQAEHEKILKYIRDDLGEHKVYAEIVRQLGN